VTAIALILDVGFPGFERLARAIGTLLLYLYDKTLAIALRGGEGNVKNWAQRKGTELIGPNQSVYESSSLPLHKTWSRWGGDGLGHEAGIRAIALPSY
jgi:hypothetical protein